MPTLDELREAVTKADNEAAWNADYEEVIYRQRDLIAALDADRKAQQQRIADLEKALEPITGMYAAYHDWFISQEDDDPTFLEWLTVGMQYSLMDAIERAHDALNADADGK